MTINPLAAGWPLGAATSSTASTTPNQAGNDSEAAFMNLLITELKAQDPTSPMDPTQMVGQMLSMNQLNELIAINQTLQTALGMSAATPQTSSSATQFVTGAH